ncbi:MAG TPA: hypothetical protein VHW95_07835 [Steroidobacteraceae bacterium]|jgi:hypothetical protein|nr:hypothetical protein [Steroidobacteraceae bacterium]
MESIDGSTAWWGGSIEPTEIIVLCHDGVLNVAIRIPRVLKSSAIRGLDMRLQELFNAIDQLDGRLSRETPVVQSRCLVDEDQDCLIWSREYADPGYPLQFTQALRAMASLGIAQSLH